MADHTHVVESSDSSGMGFFLGIILLVIVLFMLFFYGLPLLRNTGSSNPTINVPDKVNVDVNQKY